MRNSIVQWISQFFVLLLKNLRLRFKAKLSLVAELAAPIVLFVLWVGFMGMTSYLLLLAPINRNKLLDWTLRVY